MGCEQSAKRVNITDELLAQLPRIDPVTEECEPAEVLGVTGELLREQEIQETELSLIHI